MNLRKIITILTLMLAFASVDVYFNNYSAQYKEPSADKHQKRRKKNNVGKKKLFGRHKNKKLKKNQDPFVVKAQKRNKGNVQKPIVKSRKGKIKEQDAFVTKSKKNKKYKKKRGKKRKDKGKTNRKVEQNQYAI